jgi:hypothetical protein
MNANDTDKTVLKINGEYYTIIREGAYRYYLYTPPCGCSACRVGMHHLCTSHDDMTRYRTKNQARKQARALAIAKSTAEIAAITAKLRALLK